MTNRRGLLLMGLPLIAVLGLFSAMQIRRSAEPMPVARSPRSSSGGDSGGAVEMRVQSSSANINRTPAAPTRMPPAKDIGTAVSNARIQTTYANFRIAVANNNRQVQGALLPVLQQHRETALWYARDDVAMARTEQDRSIALRTLGALEK